MRILFASNAPWVPTGFGTQSNFITYTLMRHGHDLGFYANFGWFGAKIESAGMPIYPPLDDAWGVDSIAGHIADFNADVLLSFHGIWVYNPDYRDQVTVPWIGLFPLDHYPPPEVIARRAMQFEYPVCYSKFGQKAMKEVGVDCHYIPHGIDCETFKPGDKAAARERLGWPQDRYIISMVAANRCGPHQRKAFPENFAAIGRFIERNKELDPLVYVHSETDNNPAGINLPELARHPYPGVAGFEDRLMMPNQYRYRVGLPHDYVATVYRASDCLSAAARGEGFGLPIPEAQACGCPVVTTNFSSMTELTVNGIATESLQLHYTDLESWQANPDIDAILEALETIAGRTDDEREQNAARGVEFVRSELSHAVVSEMWREFMAGVESDVCG